MAERIVTTLYFIGGPMHGVSCEVGGGVVPALRFEGSSSCYNLHTFDDGDGRVDACYVHDQLPVGEAKWIWLATPRGAWRKEGAARRQVGGGTRLVQFDEE